MQYPSPSKYKSAIQNLKVCLSDPELRESEVETDPLGMPRVFSGGFALTYHLRNRNLGKEFALRCFHRYRPDLERRYDLISHAIQDVAADFFIPFVYQPDGILVDGRHYPIVKMHWVSAPTLSSFIEANLEAPEVLEGLAGELRRVVKVLRESHMAHGDLSHGNVLVQEGKLLLIDYDGMFVPGLSGEKAIELGHANYQHPGRDEGYFGEDLDNFSAIVIYTSLLALSENPDLWDRYHTGENLILSAEDFLAPRDSQLVSEIADLGDGPAGIFKRLVTLFETECHQIPTLEEWLQGTTTRAAVTRAVLAPVSPDFTPRLSPYPVVEATHRTTLLELEGCMLEVVGVVTEVKFGHTRWGKPYVFINFGDWRKGCFTVVIWSDLLQKWQGVDLDVLPGKRVSVTGFLEVYEPRSKRGLRRPAHPQIILDNWRKLKLISEDEPVVCAPVVNQLSPLDNESVPPFPTTEDSLNRSVLDRLRSVDAGSSNQQGHSQGKGSGSVNLAVTQQLAAVGGGTSSPSSSQAAVQGSGSTPTSKVQSGQQDPDVVADHWGCMGVKIACSLFLVLELARMCAGA